MFPFDAIMSNYSEKWLCKIAPCWKTNNYTKLHLPFKFDDKRWCIWRDFENEIDELIILWRTCGWIRKSHLITDVDALLPHVFVAIVGGRGGEGTEAVGQEIDDGQLEIHSSTIMTKKTNRKWIINFTPKRKE